MNPLTSPVERERRLAETSALEVSQRELEKQLERLDAEKEGARVAARLREKEIRETVARTARRVRNDLAAEVYATLTPVVQALLKEPSREKVRELVATWQGFKDRCLAETGRPLEARPVTNIMIAELAGSATAIVNARAFDTGGGFSVLANLEGGLTAALADGFNFGAIGRSIEAIEAEILRTAHSFATSETGERQAAQWEAQRTALSGPDASVLLAAMEPAPPEPYPLDLDPPGPTLGNVNDTSIPSETERAAYRDRVAAFMARRAARGTP